MNVRRFVLASIVSVLMSSLVTYAQAVETMCGGGVCTVDNLVFAGGKAGAPINVDIFFDDLKTIQLDPTGASTTDVEFLVGNTTNEADLDYKITMDLIDYMGNALTTDMLIVESTVPASLNQVVSQPLNPLPAGVEFQGLRFVFDTSCPGTCDNSLLAPTFDVTVAGGGGILGTAASGPIKFNRASGGVVPEPNSMATVWIGAACIAIWRRRSRS